MCPTRLNYRLSRIRNWGLLTTLLVGLAVGLLPAHEIYAATLTVTNANDSGAGSLRQAIANAASGDTIVFDSSLQGATITLTSGQLSINKRLTITGLGADNLTVRGNNAYRVFNIGASAVVTITDLTIADGYVKNARGGGISNAGSLILQDSVVSRNSIDGTLLGLLKWGGSGVYNAGALTVARSTISDNKDKNNSAGGGGIFNDGGLILQDSVVQGNQVHTISLWGDYGGGGICNRGIMTITHSTVVSNTVLGYSYGGGGGIYNSGASQLAYTAVMSNSSGPDSKGAYGGFGGGILNWAGGTLVVEHSTIAGNVADRDAGGIENVGTLTVTASTVSGNLAKGNRPSSGSGQVGLGGGGIYNTEGNLTLVNSTISNNMSDQYGGGLVNDEGALALTFVTLGGNSAGVIGGGIYITGSVTETLTYLTDSIIAGSVGQDCVSQAGVITNTRVLIQDNTCSPDLSGDPMLGPLQDNGGDTETQALQFGSPAIDQASCIGITIDQRDLARPIDIPDVPNWAEGCDLGAFEVQQ